MFISLIFDIRGIEDIDWLGLSFGYIFVFFQQVESSFVRSTWGKVMYFQQKEGGLEVGLVRLIDVQQRGEQYYWEVRIFQEIERVNFVKCGQGLLGD